MHFTNCTESVIFNHAVLRHSKSKHFSAMQLYNNFIVFYAVGRNLLSLTIEPTYSLKHLHSDNDSEFTVRVHIETICFYIKGIIVGHQLSFCHKMSQRVTNCNNDRVFYNIMLCTFQENSDSHVK